MRLILASKSPRRKEILQMLGVPFTVETADTDESSDLTDPALLTEELASRKGRAILDRLTAEGRDLSDTVIFSCDTVVSVAGEILGKPRDEEDACRMLSLYSGRAHLVVSGISLMGMGKTAVSHDTTTVEFDTMSPEEIRAYVRAERPYDKAGAYAIQGAASAFIRGIQGDFYNVVGLPVHRLCELFRATYGVALTDLGK